MAQQASSASRPLTPQEPCPTRRVLAPLSQEQLQRAPYPVDLDVNGRVLLSPPALFEGANPLEVMTVESPEDVRSLGDTEMLNNMAAFSRNHEIAKSLIRPGSAHEANRDVLNGLHIRTDVRAPTRSGSSYSLESESRLRTSASASSLPRRIPSIRAALHSAAGSISPGSVLSSPQIAAMLDITPLPSPTLGASDPWKIVARTRSRGSSTASRTDVPAYAFAASSLSPASPPRRKAYHGLRPTADSANGSDERPNLADGAPDPRNRSVSDYVPEAIAIPKPRNIAVSSSGPAQESGPSSANMHREEYLGITRGLVSPVENAGGLLKAEEDRAGSTVEMEPTSTATIYTARSVSTDQVRQYVSIRQLGQGTFSKVYLAVRKVDGETDPVDYTRSSTDMAGVRLRSKRLVAVKVIEHGPAGGADADRVEISLQREVEIMKSMKHPSLVHLKAFGSSAHAKALLIMSYCPGGDLFELASTKLEVLVPPLIRRIFAELVSAVRFLHQHYVVHRDIKLENVLLNIPVEVHSDVHDWQTLDRAVVTLTDLGLSRRIPEPPESPLLTTRCGSEDYAAPELLMGQPYDGRQTDAWALGVLLYALLEGRLPFDPLPGARGDPAVLKARTPHRIARIEWAWYKYGDDDGDWDAQKGKDLDGAFACVDGLLRRNTRRRPLDEIRKLAWVRDGIQIDGGLSLVDEETL